MRFSKYDREQVAKQAAELATTDLAVRLSKTYEQLVAALEEAALSAIEDPKERALARQCPRHFFDSKCVSHIEVDGKSLGTNRTLYLFVPKSAKVPQEFTSQQLPGKLMAEAVELSKEKDRLYKQVQSQTYAALCRFSTVKKCRDEWPEIAYLLPKEPEPGASNLPVLRSQIEGLNKLIPLPPVPVTAT